MEKEMPKILVQDVVSSQTLFQCSLDQAELAYAYAAQMEEMGLDVKVINPTLSQTLSSSLGLAPEEVARYEESMNEELEHHEGSCCFENDDKSLPK